LHRHFVFHRSCTKGSDTPTYQARVKETLIALRPRARGAKGGARQWPLSVGLQTWEMGLIDTHQAHLMTKLALLAPDRGF